jgi:uncharacterized protein YndB with AHSA1/START domain
MASTSPAAPKALAVSSTPPLRVERRFRAAPERVFEAWTTAAELNRWSDPDSTSAVAEVDLRVGGRYAIAMARPNGSVHRVSGVYREIDAPRRLVYTWRWETIPGFPDTVVTVEFRARGDGGTDLVLVHEGLPDDDSGKRHAHGWAESLTKLSAVVA